ncbi:MAG: UbiA-like protein EboC [Bacteroidota bacterium]
MRFKYFIAIARPANVVTSIADIVGGIFIAYSFLENAGDFSFSKSILLVMTTSCLYAGGIIFNDVLDLKEDQEHRPDRLIPSGKISLREAITFGIVLFTTALICSFLVGMVSLYFTVGVIGMTFIYNSVGKKSSLFGPITMGLCRSGNLMLGISIIPQAISQTWMISLIPLLFIAGVTLTAQGEVLGNNQKSIGIAIMIDCLTALSILFICRKLGGEFVQLIPFLILWLGSNLVFKVNAIRLNTPSKIITAVKMGVLSIIALDACYVASFGNWSSALFVLVLLPISILFAKKFQVT